MIFLPSKPKTLPLQHTWTELNKDVKATKEAIYRLWFLRIHPTAAIRDRSLRQLSKKRPWSNIAEDIEYEGWCLLEVCWEHIPTESNMAHSKIPGHGMLHPKSQLHDGFLLKEIPEQDKGVLSQFFSKFSHSQTTPTILTIFLHYCLFSISPYNPFNVFAYINKFFLG